MCSNWMRQEQTLITKSWKISQESFNTSLVAFWMSCMQGGRAEIRNQSDCSCCQMLQSFYVLWYSFKSIFSGFYGSLYFKCILSINVFICLNNWMPCIILLSTWAREAVEFKTIQPRNKWNMATHQHSSIWYISRVKLDNTAQNPICIWNENK